jgi:Arc/MetJ-type ribon-helix-helix transcriptional regulator
MKISISLQDEVVEYVDSCVKLQRAANRSAAIQKAIRLMKMMEMAPQYQAEWQEWEKSEDAGLWDNALSDGLAQ